MIDLDRIGRTIRLCQGKGNPEQGQACWMSAISYYEGSQWSDHPDCVCPIIRYLAVNANDWCESDEQRRELIGPRLFQPVGTRTDDPAVWKAREDACYRFAARVDPRGRSESWWRETTASFAASAACHTKTTDAPFLTELVELIDELCEIGRESRESIPPRRSLESMADLLCSADS